MTQEASPETFGEDDPEESFPSPDLTDAAEEEEAEHEQTAGEDGEQESPAMSEKEIEKATKALEREATAHANRVSRIMGEAAQSLIPCELCAPNIPGFRWPLELAPLDDAQREAVLAAIGQGVEAAPPLKQAVGVRMCDACDGYGQLEYPTRNPHVATQQCPRCAGQGYVSAETPTANVTPIVTSSFGTPTAPQGASAACPICGTMGVRGQPHWCNPVAATGG